MRPKEYKDDVSLWRRFLGGDKEAYAHIFEKYVRVLFLYGSQFTDDRELVKDCIQDVFVKIHTNRKNLGPCDNIKFYLFGALRNSIINSLKRSARCLPMTQTGKLAPPRVEDHSLGIETAEEERAMQRKVSRIMEVLTPRQKQAVHYRYIDNLTIREISDIMNMSYQAVLNTIQRALKRIRTNYSN